MINVLLCFLCLSILLGSCTEDGNSSSNLQSYRSAYQPVLAERSTLDRITFSEPQSIVNAGKIYLYGNYILINEIDKGYHIIDNTDQKNPKNVGFITILASREVVVRDNILYADNSLDLISIDVSDIKNPKLISRIKDVFPERSAPDNLPLQDQYKVNNRPANTLVIEWRKIK